MNRPATEVRSARPDEVPQAISAIVAAFITDPFARFLWPSPYAYLQSGPAFVRAFAGRGFACGSAYVCADFSGAALWLPPDVHPDAETLETVVRETAEPARLDDAFGALEQMAQVHPAGRHWYLPLIGVDPSRRGQGVGDALMRHALARCDEDGVPAYLESTNPRNVSLYRRHGFDVVGEIAVGACPLLTPMSRPPR
ncbi:MAG: GNAT family N-acetyltransferase [bacterium]|nr:GNAT family N-acetyltransferase [bacterium]